MTEALRAVTGRVVWGVPALLRSASIVLATVALVACSTTGVTRAEPTAPPTGAATPTASPAPTAPPTAAPTTTPPPDWNAPPVIANDAAALGTQLATVEAIIRDPNAPAAQLAWAGHAEQLCISRLADFPEWTDQVLAALPAGPRATIAASIEAGKQLRLLHAGPIPKSLPDWHIVQPPPIDELMSYYKEAEATFGVPWYVLASINLIETRMGRIRGDSSAGAQGPMQFIPSTWAAYGAGGDVNSYRDSILAAGRYLKAAGAPGDLKKAIFAYNHSSFYVNAVTGYGEAMRADPSAYRGFYGWQVYYPTLDGPILMPPGWTKP
ncbi:MAG TPA: lytic transglycosylase domain-containing protein [Candidatus Limnocylindria bacterium]|nr:lytic transglycosylase domain-containing protein [Candidatus Limnocylindria bacterium]